jgi:hypothetical protein
VRKYLPYLIPAGLIVLAIYIVVTRPGPPGLSEAELAEIRDTAQRVPREKVEARLVEMVAEAQRQLPLEMAWGRSLRAIEARDLTVEARVRLDAEESAADLVTVGDYFQSIGEELCQDRNVRIMLEADAVLLVEIEKVDGNLMRYVRLSKDSCRG